MRIFGCALVGIHGRPIEVKADYSPVQQGAVLLGLTGAIVREGWGRAKLAIEHSGFDPVGRAGINFDLSPSAFPKNDATLDLPLAIVGLLALAKAPRREPGDPAESASEEEIEEYFQALESHNERLLEAETVLKRAESQEGCFVLIGNLDPITGDLRRDVGGVLSRLLSIESASLPSPVRVVVPRQCETEASLVVTRTELDVYVADNLREVYELCLLGHPGRRVRPPSKSALTERGIPQIDLADIEGLASAKEAAEIASAGGHHILFWGRAGMGKSLLAQAMVGLMPRMDYDEFFAVNQILDAAGELPEGGIQASRPIRAISSSITSASLLGGGSQHPTPGEISKAHCGILLIDEFNELDRKLLDELRNPLQSGKHQISRNNFREEFPCRFQLIGTMNPCKCSRWGYYVCGCGAELDADWCPNCEDDAAVEHTCTCSPRDVKAYRDRISGPIVGRIDLKVRVSDSLTEKVSRGRKTSTAARSIRAAVKLQDKRFAGRPERRNGDLTRLPVSKILEALGQEGPVKAANERLREIRLKTRGNHRQDAKILAVSRTIADIEQVRRIQADHIDHAAAIMGLWDEYWTADLMQRKQGGVVASKHYGKQIAAATVSCLRRKGLTVTQLAQKASVRPHIIRMCLSGQVREATPAVERVVDVLKS